MAAPRDLNKRFSWKPSHGDKLREHKHATKLLIIRYLVILADAFIVKEQVRTRRPAHGCLQVDYGQIPADYPKCPLHKWMVPIKLLNPLRYVGTL